MEIDDELPPREPMALWQLLAKGASGDLQAQREIVDYYRSETFERSEYEKITHQAEMWARIVVANSQDYADIPKLIDALVCRYEEALHVAKDQDRATKVAIEIAAWADLLSEHGNNSAIEDFGICFDFPSDHVRREASAMKEHWMRSKYCLSQMVFAAHHDRA